ncbi:MAG: 50S ribosomal protein P1 [archaeon]
MELVYAAMLLHKAGKPINEENVKKVMDAAGVKKDDAQVKALVAALEGVDIEKAIKEASVPVAVAAPSAGEKPAEKKEEKPEKSKEEDEAKATAGLGALFG